jgi:hypothetical protein
MDEDYFARLNGRHLRDVMKHEENSWDTNFKMKLPVKARTQPSQQRFYILTLEGFV